MSENGNMHTKSAAQQATTTKIKRETACMLMKNGVLSSLPSLTPARDLTLGGRGGAGGGTNKKVFTPNLNVVRNKNAAVKTSKDTTTRGGRGTRGKTERGRGGRGGGNSTLIQTAGVFSEGAGAINIRKTTSNTYSYGRNSDDAPSAMRKPTLVKNEFQKIDLKADAEHVRELIGDSDEDDFVDDKTDLEQKPIKLNDAKWKLLKTEIKRENHDNHYNLINSGLSMNGDDESALNIAQQLQTLHVMQQQNQQINTPGSLIHYPQGLEGFLQTTKPTIFVMQLPDALPCEQDDSDSPDKHSKMNATSDVATTSSTSTTTPATKTTNITHSFKKMEEGQVGKLIRYKSGKVKLVLGETFFDLNIGMETGFMQDLMSVSTNREERSGNMINLGPVEAKLTATPDWEHLLSQEHV